MVDIAEKAIGFFLFKKLPLYVSGGRGRRRMNWLIPMKAYRLLERDVAY